MIEWLNLKKTNLADCDRDVGSFLNDGEIRTWNKKKWYASLILTPFKAADNTALINNSSVLDPRKPKNNFKYF